MSGKGTQAARLTKTLEIPHVASGDLFRDNIKRQTDLGKEAQAYIDRGDLVPDQVTIGMVEERLQRPDCQGGVLLDGFPRTIPQAEALDQILVEMDRQLTGVIYITVPEDVLVERASGRRICRICGRSYHMAFDPPEQDGVCDLDGGELYQRPDDQAETVRQRLKVYWNLTSPLIDFYRSRGILAEVDGNQAIDQVTEEIRQAVIR
jgi:adenylate kinase